MIRWSVTHVASGAGSIAVGIDNMASSVGTIAIGFGNSAIGSTAMAIGSSNTSTSGALSDALTMGISNTAGVLVEV